MSEHDESDLFLQEMQGVKKLQSTAKVDLKRPQQTTEAQKARQQAAVTDQQQVEKNHLQHYDVPKVQPHDVLGYKRPGIQDGVFRKLRLGKYDIEARLDLHRMTIDHARSALYNFIEDCMRYDLRTVLILPGKGDRNMEDPAVLKSHLVHWLPQLDDVQAFHTAQPKDGGAGALYILLRKSERKKEKARIQFNKGRT